MSDRNLIIDGQILQTGAWHRGMGRYLLQVLTELQRDPPADTALKLLFNSRLPVDDARHETLKYLLPDFDLLIADLPLPDATAGPTDKIAVRQYRAQLSRFVADQLPGPDNIYLLTSLFLFDFFAEFPENCRRLVLFYDLTPLLFWHDLGGYFPPELYMPRFMRLLEAERIFAISETTRQDLLRTFGLPPTSVVNINGGFIKLAERPHRPPHVPVAPRYVLFPTGDLPHKNNRIAVEGFAHYCQSTQSDLRLLITSHFSEESKAQLLALSPQIAFTGNVSDEELAWLYEHAAAVLFASKYEGLGMPVLDAVAGGKPIVAARIPVFEEMSHSAFYYFDPADNRALETALAQALEQGVTEHRQADYDKIMKTYTWKNTVNSIRKVVAEQPAAITMTAPKPRLAVATLHPGIIDQLGRMAEPLYSVLREAYEVDFYFDGNGVHYRDMERPTFLDHLECRVFDITQLDIRAYRHYQTVLYLIDDKALPSRVMQRAVVLPGQVLMPADSGAASAWHKLVADSQLAVHHYKADDYESRRQLLTTLQAKKPATKGRLARTVAILHNHGSNRSIINKLKAIDDAA